VVDLQNEGLVVDPQMMRGPVVDPQMMGASR